MAKYSKPLQFTHQGTPLETSKTEVLQTPSATEVNLAQGVVRGFDFLKIFWAFENFWIFQTFEF